MVNGAPTIALPALADRAITGVPYFTVNVKVERVEAVALVAVMTYVVVGDDTFGVPKINPVRVLKLKPEGSIGEIE